MTSAARVRRRAASIAAVSLVVSAAGAAANAAPTTTTGPAPASAVAAKTPPPLPIGDAKLVEKRSARTIAPGVTVTTIVRGDKPAKASNIATTPYGPWRITVTSIDPARAKGYALRTTAGPTLAATDFTSNLAKAVGALVAMNGGYFAFTKSPSAPGDPIGLMIVGGTVLSEQTGTVGEHDVLIDDRTMKLRMGKYRWTGDVLAKKTGERFALDGVNRIPAVPKECADADDPRECDASGSTIRFTPQWAASTPAGPGAEVVLDRKGCVTRVLTKRGARLSPSQWSIQATGSDARDLLDAVPEGCIDYVEKVRDSDGAAVKIDSHTYGLTGRYRLLAGGENVVPQSSSAFFSRNPRSIIGRTASGKVALVTIDGRQTSTVGATLDEAARVAKGLGLVDAVNLDGGESSTMVVKGQVVNRVMRTTQRKVSDAVVLVRR